MENVLNLALKKDVFEGLTNGTLTEIPIKKNNWWKKRLMDLDTGRFKEFNVACVSSGSSDKYVYEISNLELRGDDFIVTVIQPEKAEPDRQIAPENINPVKLEPVEVNPVIVVNEGENVVMKQEYTRPLTEVEKKVILNDVLPEEEDDEPEETQDVPEDKDVKEIVSNLFNKFCELNDVYVVNMPYVHIRSNGQILGCRKRLIADRDNDVKFTFTVKELTKYPNDSNSYFTLLVMGYINALLKNNYVFVNKSECGFKEDEWGNITLKIVATAKKKYIFPKQ